MNDPITRRKMLQNVALFAGGMCLCHAAFGDDDKSTCCNTPELSPDSYSIENDLITIDLKKAEPLSSTGYAALIVHQEKKLQLIIVRTGEKEYSALHRICTHGGNVVSYNQKRNILQCNNYNHSIFDLQGLVVKGPAPTPLKNYPIKLESDKLIISLFENN